MADLLMQQPSPEKHRMAVIISRAFSSIQDAQRAAFAAPRQRKIPDGGTRRGSKIPGLEVHWGS